MTVSFQLSLDRIRRALLGAVALSALAVIGGAASAENAEPVHTDSVSGSVATTDTEVERFCSNIADAARDRRYVLQTKELETLQQEVDKRLALLEEKRAEYESWMKRREEFISMATDSIVKIYGGMRADAAAERLAELDARLAAAILMKLDSRKAGVILNEMERKAAASLTSIMVSASRRSDPT